MLLTRSVVVAVIAAVATGQDYEDRPDYRGYQGPLNLCQDLRSAFKTCNTEIKGSTKFHNLYERADTFWKRRLPEQYADHHDYARQCLVRTLETAEIDHLCESNKALQAVYDCYSEAMLETAPWKFHREITDLNYDFLDCTTKHYRKLGIALEDRKALLNKTSSQSVKPGSTSLLGTSTPVPKEKQKMTTMKKNEKKKQ